jgi:hypothetical protein
VDIRCQFFQFFLECLQFKLGVALGEAGGRPAHGVECGESEELDFRVFGGDRTGIGSGAI